jgi:putative membrane protein
MSWIVKLLLNAVALIIAAYLLPGVEVANFYDAVIVAIVLAILNAFVKPLLVIVTIPITLLTLGLFLFFINAIILLIADKLVDGFDVNGVGWAFLLSLVMSILNSIFGLNDKSNQQKNK